MNFLPGWMPGAAGAGGAEELTDIAVVTRATSTGASLTAPANIQPGDLLMWCDSPFSFGVPTLVIPAGFTLIVDAPDGFVRTVVAYKIADGSEASSSIAGMSGELNNRKLLCVFRGNTLISEATANDVDFEVTNDTPANQTITASGGTVPLVVFAAYAVHINPGSLSPTWDDIESFTASSAGIHLAWKVYNAAASPTNHVASTSDQGNGNTLISFFLELV